MDQERTEDRGWVRALLAGLVIAIVAIGGIETGSAEEQSLGEKIGDTAQKVGTKIEEGVKKVVKKIEDKHVIDKVARKLDKAAKKTAEGFEKVGNKIKQQLAD